MRRISIFGTSTDDVAVAREITKEAYEKILIVASAISQVINVSTVYNSGVLDSINNNISVINGVYNITEAINTLNNDIVAIESLFADKATLDSIYADKAVIDSLESIKDKLEYLYDNIDTLNILYTDRTVWNSVFNYLNEINEVSLQLTSIEAVQNKLTEITQVYTSLNAIVSLYDNMIDINTVATVISDVINVSNVSTDVSTVADNISTIINVYNSISNINTVASKITDINNFTAVWLGTFSTAPTTRTDASPLQLGDLYFNTTTDSVKVYASTGWINAGSSVNGVASAIDYVATEGQTVFNSVYDTGYVFVWRNGFKLSATDFTATDGTTITLTDPASNGDIISVLSFGSFSATDASLMPFNPSGTLLTSVNVENAIKEVENKKINSDDLILVSAYQSVAVSVTANTVTKMLFQTEKIDTHNIFNNSRLTPTKAGWYRINCRVYIGSTGSALTRCFLQLTKNGTTTYNDEDQQASAGIRTAQTSRLVYFNGTTDYLEANLYVEGSNALTRIPNEATIFEAEFIRS